ncbi:hypothetical protein Tco_0666439 [Tanacetum coccineum]
MSKLLYTRFTKLIINHFLSNNKNIPCISSSKLHKLSNTIKGDYKFGMEIPDTMISDAIKKLAGYKFYMAKKVEIPNVPTSLKIDIVPRKTRSQTIAEETNSINTYAEWGQKLKGPAVDDPAVQSLLNLRKGSKVSSDKTEESENETDYADDYDMDLSDDNPHGNDDAVVYGVCSSNKTFIMEMFPDENAHHLSSPPAKKIPYNATTLQPSSLQAKAKKLMQKGETEYEED